MPLFPMGKLVGLPSVTVTRGKAHEAIGKLVFVDEGAELAAQVWRIAHCAIPVANDGLSDEGCEVVVIFPADTYDC